MATPILVAYRPAPRCRSQAACRSHDRLLRLDGTVYDDKAVVLEGNLNLYVSELDNRLVCLPSL